MTFLLARYNVAGSTMPRPTKLNAKRTANLRLRGAVARMFERRYPEKGQAAARRNESEAS